MDSPRSRPRANPMGPDQSEHKPACPSQALEPTKTPSELANLVNLFGLEQKYGPGLDTMPLLEAPAPESALKPASLNRNVLRQSQGCRTPQPGGRSGALEPR